MNPRFKIVIYMVWSLVSVGKYMYKQFIEDAERSGHVFGVLSGIPPISPFQVAANITLFMNYNVASRGKLSTM